MTKYLDSDAYISNDGAYRYWLRRQLSEGSTSVLFVGLNPSTADARLDDPTIRRCVGFAREWGYAWLYMANLYAYRTKDPNALPAHADLAIGPENAYELRRLLRRSTRIVAAWGRHKLHPQARTLARTVAAHRGVYCLGLNQDGSPRHPLFVPKSCTLQFFERA